MIQLESSWQSRLNSEFQKPYMMKLMKFLSDEQKANKIIYPRMTDIFNALNTTSFEKVKVVILGQDPYHGLGQAHGFCFSVPKGTKLPPSLKNIYQELKNDLGINPSDTGNLESWAKQGVLLLNTVLTVEHGKAGSHHQKGWEIFTDKIIEILNQEKKHLVFILWGSPAQKNAAQVDIEKHCILKSPHPSPLSSYRGFFGSKPFSKCNEYLSSNGLPPIVWNL